MRHNDAISRHVEASTERKQIKKRKTPRTPTPLAEATGISNIPVLTGLGLLGFVGLLWFNKHCSQDTPEANRLARQVLFGIYLALAILAVLGIIMLQRRNTE